MLSLWLRLRIQVQPRLDARSQCVRYQTSVLVYDGWWKEKERRAEPWRRGLSLGAQAKGRERTGGKNCRLDWIKPTSGSGRANP